MSTPPEDAQSIVNKSITRFEIAPSPALATYLTQVLEWNSTLGLVSRKDPIAAVERLLLESIELGRLLALEGNLRIADVGSGAGFPGVVWALLHPQLHLTLIERRQRRALFLERVCRTMGAGNVRVLAHDLHDVSPELANEFDLVVSMAVGDPASIGSDADRILVKNGRFASTISRETAPPVSITNRLRLEQRHEGEFGCYVVYRCGV
jgi:16S rRNA (guanine527-N7)-methyltransferase